jgi:hypothetical protein
MFLLKKIKEFLERMALDVYGRDLILLIFLQLLVFSAGWMMGLYYLSSYGDLYIDWPPMSYSDIRHMFGSE